MYFEPISLLIEATVKEKNLGPLEQILSFKSNSKFEVTQLFLARLFSKKTSRYCHSPGVGGDSVVQKL